jgi:hypothetical protein
MLARLFRSSAFDRAANRWAAFRQAANRWAASRRAAFSET